MIPGQLPNVPDNSGTGLPSESDSSGSVSETVDLSGETPTGKTKNSYGYAAIISVLVSLGCAYLIASGVAWILIPSMGFFWFLFAFSGLGGLVAVIMGVRGVRAVGRGEANNQVLSFVGFFLGLMIVGVFLFLLWLFFAPLHFYDG